MRLYVVGLNYRATPLEAREQFAVSSLQLPEALGILRREWGAQEAVILSTCNRIELYVASSDPSVTSPHLLQFLASRGALSLATFRQQSYAFEDREAAAHLFRVTAGMDSMVLGESEIVAQVKQAYLTARLHGAAGSTLNRLFQKALHGSKLIRSTTAIAAGQGSIGSVVVDLTTRLVGKPLADCDVLLWGAGKAAEATTHHLIKHGIRQLWIVNRTQAKAQDLASLCQGGWLSWEQALAHLAHVDVAIVCTHAPHYVIDGADLDAVMPGRAGRPLFIIDLAVPRNVDPSLKARSGVHLYNVDDLQDIANETSNQRSRTLEACEALIQQQVGHVMRRWQHEAHGEGKPCRLIEAFSSAS